MNGNWDTTSENYHNSNHVWTGSFIDLGVRSKKRRRGKTKDELRDQWGVYEESEITLYCKIKGLPEVNITKVRKHYLNGRKPVEFSIKGVAERIMEALKPTIKVKINE